ncbi:MAG: BrnA antitoxin family protein [Thiotrichales bacterium]|jgi:uncharacterized protein (DUF4415 family)|nr:BrnA antitoxin family protein [Thiotrichales bacterium]MBT3613416.1 BrnA antitoxin family protein [Thiotrichales bacterium]MBT3751915.1 BrnA antitoxin family protein [Thiotrichales bacterium]MBT3837600.1 BrnA antitoxin family protein [Thiotrichales bacterium]MBT4152943.1 BrnA antitoxin family protein [Thiotrichales bacterium]
MPKLKPDTIFPTDEEDAIITQQAIEDGTNFTDDELMQFRPASEIPELKDFVKKMGRPKSDNPKKAISIRLSNDTLDFFKATGKGWQSRIDEVLTKYATSH